MPLEGSPPVARKSPRSSWYVGSRGPPPVSQLRRCDPASGAFSPHEALSRRGARPTSVPTTLRRRVMVGRTSFVDFCNRIVSRARPRFVRAPLHRAPGRPCAQLLLDLARRSRDARAPRLRVAECLVRRRAYARRREDLRAGLPGVTSSHRLRDDLRPRTNRLRDPSGEADPGP